MQIHIHRFEAVTSTNDVAARLALQGAPEGVVVTADLQTAGRGRFGRAWASPPGAGVYASVVFRPTREVAPLLTIAAGVAIADGVQAATGLAAELKWPNDLYVGARKLAGILAEAADAAVVLGFGINVLPAAYPADVSARATSIEAELGRRVDRELVLSECLSALASRYAALQRGEQAAVIAAWRRRGAARFGRRVEWDRTSGPGRGIAQDIDAQGALLVTTDTGIERVISGEVRWLP